MAPRGGAKFFGISFFLHAILIMLFVTVSPLHDLLRVQISTVPQRSGNVLNEKNAAQVRTMIEQSAAARIRKDLEALQKSTGKVSGSTQGSVPELLRTLDATLKKTREKERDDRAQALSKALQIPVDEAAAMLPPVKPATGLPALAEHIEKMSQEGSDPDQVHALKQALLEATKLSKSETEATQENLLSLRNTTDPAKILNGVSISTEAPVERVSQQEAEAGRAEGFYGDGSAMMPAAPGKVSIMPSYIGPPLSPGEERMKNLIGGRDFPSLPGLRVRPASKEGRALRSGPVYLDAWYVIGPWELKKREDFSQAFTPEVEVDLDAEYPGNRYTKNKPLRWQFVESEEPMVELPLQISDSSSYAYTEIIADAPLLAWLICGLDDRGKAWLNGEEILNSANSFKGWQVGNEGARPVLLKRGKNTLLLRIDNRPGETRFSAILYPYQRQ